MKKKGNENICSEREWCDSSELVTGSERTPWLMLQLLLLLFFLHSAVSNRERGQWERRRRRRRRHEVFKTKPIIMGKKRKAESRTQNAKRNWALPIEKMENISPPIVFVRTHHCHAQSCTYIHAYIHPMTLSLPYVTPAGGDKLLQEAFWHVHKRTRMQCQWHSSKAD